MGYHDNLLTVQVTLKNGTKVTGKLMGRLQPQEQLLISEDGSSVEITPGGFVLYLGSAEVVLVRAEQILGVSPAN